MVTATIFIYFIYNGRFPYRVTFSVLILYILPLLFLIWDVQVSIWKNRWFQYAVFAVVIGAFVYSICGSCGLTRIAYSISKDSTRLESIQTKIKVEQYAIENPDNLYVYDYSLALAGDPFVTYEDGKPYNLTFWGGSGMYSPPYYDQLRANGREEFYSDSFLDDNVFFIGSQEPDAELIDYMKSEFSEKISTQIVYEGDGFIVYQFKDSR